MKKLVRNISSYKTTILGIVLLLFAGYAILHLEEHNEYLIGGLLLSGILLVVSPDSYVLLFEKFMDKKFKNNNDEPIYLKPVKEHTIFINTLAGSIFSVVVINPHELLATLILGAVGAIGAYLGSLFDKMGCW